MKGVSRCTCPSAAPCEGWHVRLESTDLSRSAKASKESETGHCCGGAGRQRSTHRRPSLCQPRCRQSNRSVRAVGPRPRQLSARKQSKARTLCKGASINSRKNTRVAGDRSTAYRQMKLDSSVRSGRDGVCRCAGAHRFRSSTQRVRGTVVHPRRGQQRQAARAVAHIHRNRFEQRAGEDHFGARGHAQRAKTVRG